MKFFWGALPKPFFILAPMEDVTDTVFRQIIAGCARPDVFFTEFTNVDGLRSGGRDIVAQRLQFTQSEHPIVAQLWGSKPENYLATAKSLVEAGFDGIDINMGCPEKKVVKNGGCAALINNPSLAREIVVATKEGAAGRIPVSVKTRIGYGSIVTADWISFLLSLGLDALTIHGRTAAEMSKVPAHWDEIGKAVKVRDDMGIKTLIIGNGDVTTRSDALDKVKMYKVDGVMIGRGVFENPWIFDSSKKPKPHSLREHLELMRRHVELFESTWGGHKHFPILKKFFKIYIKGFDGASDVRARFMLTQNAPQVYAILDEMMNVVR